VARQANSYFITYGFDSGGLEERGAWWFRMGVNSMGIWRSITDLFTLNCDLGGRGHYLGTRAK
jgi:hypothetical protein